MLVWRRASYQVECIQGIFSHSHGFCTRLPAHRLGYCSNNSLCFDHKTDDRTKRTIRISLLSMIFFPCILAGNIFAIENIATRERARKSEKSERCIYREVNLIWEWSFHWKQFKLFSPKNDCNHGMDPFPPIFTVWYTLCVWTRFYGLSFWRDLIVQQ